MEHEHRCSFIRGLNWHTYKNLENKVLEVSRHITFDRLNTNTWSENLANILILTGSAVDTFFRDMRECPNIRESDTYNEISRRVGERRWNIYDFRDTFDPIYELSRNEIEVPFGLSKYPHPIHPFIQPFEAFSTPLLPFWWDSYNGLKHEYYDNLRSATLDNVLNALGSLLLLNCLHKCSQQYLIRMGLLTPNRSYIRNVEDLIELFQISNFGYPSRRLEFREGCTFQTSIFVFNLRADP